MRLRLLAASIVALIPFAVTAQTAQTAKPAAPAASSIIDQEEERFEEAIRSFGFLSGAAYQCLPEADRAAHDREVMRAFSGLVRLFGSDRAFFYAAAFGAGTSMSIDKAQCKSYIDDFRAGMKVGSRAQ